MAKRFTDTGKWDDPWFMDLGIEGKMLWLYLLDKCDHAGIYKVNIRLLNFHLGFNFSEEEILKNFNGRIHEFDSGKFWFISKFISYQYGILNEANRAHLSVLNRLKELGIDYQNKPLVSPLYGAKDKEKDKDKDKEKEGGIVKGEVDFEIFWDAYDKKVGKKEKIKNKWDRLSISTQEEILNYLPGYIRAVPEKRYRKNPETFLNNDGWKDELIKSNGKTNWKEQAIAQLDGRS